MSEKSAYSFPMFAQAAARLSARIDEIVDATLERIWANPGLEQWTRPEAREPATQIARASLVREVDALRRGELPQTSPEEDIAAARAAVAYGAPVTVVLHCYRAGQAALWDVWLDEAERLAPDGTGRRRLLDRGSEFMTAYVDRCAAWVELEHTRERERQIRSEEQQRMNLLRDVLDGAAADTGALGYDTRGRHLALIVWGPGAESAAADVARAVPRGSLALSVDPVTWWLWLPVEDTVTEPDELLPADYRPPQGTRIAIGGPAAGLEGFRRAHADARDAARIAAYWATPVIRHRDVALEALAANNERRARDFVRAELGALLTGDARERTLLETLDAYFAAGHNAISAAARLGVHDRTVANRLRAVEGVLGHGAPTSRRAEIETAMRLHKLFALEPVRRPSS
jgi:hypothetical protein